MSGSEIPDIRECDAAILADFLQQKGEPAFRLLQINRWIWEKGSRSFDTMSNLPLHTRNLLQQHFRLNPAIARDHFTSTDGTIKIVFGLHDGLQVEGVLIPSSGRTTACISSQAGCPLGCRFCATGRLGFGRNLSSGEIFDQVFYLNSLSLERYGTSLSNVVYMGMGEPLLNYPNVLRSVEKITGDDGMAMSSQRITLSSVGIPHMIRKMADDRLKIHLALSLHVAYDEKRSEIIPINRTHPLGDLSDALKYYYTKTRKRFTIEYILFRDVNDSVEDARLLSDFCRRFPVKINLLHYNPVPGLPYMETTAERMQAFAKFLQEKKNMVVNIRQSRGYDIMAACGQLAGITI